MEDGETLYSVCARFHCVSGYRRSEVSSTLMLGHPCGGRSPDLVTGLHHLEEASGHLIQTSESTLRFHTVLGAYFPFMNAARRRDVLDSVAGTDGSISRNDAGLPWSGVLLRHELRCCPECALEDRRRLGFAYWKVEHQFPGIWICRRHGLPLLVQKRRGARNNNWLTVKEANLKRPLASVPPRILGKLKSVADAVSWIASQFRLNPDALSSMARLRLRRQSAIASELKCTVSEIEHIHANHVLELVDSEIEHFVGFRDSKWLRYTLFDKRYSHPLRWGTALAISGPTDPDSLSRDYFEALEREPQPALFDELPGRLRARAPSDLYDALTGPVSIEQAARITNLRAGEVQRWLLKDPQLRKWWKDTSFEVKQRSAVFLLQGTLLANPGATRITLLRNAPWAFRWLETNDRDLLETLAPSPYGQRVQQKLWP